MPHVPLFVSEKFKGKSKNGLYGDVIMEIDWSVGEILHTLREQNLDKNTLVIFASDNGPWLSYGKHAGSALPLREGKLTSFEGGVRVPCIVWWPSVLPAGKTQTEPAMTIDLLPTIASLTGGQLPEWEIDGLNIWPLMQVIEGAKNPHEAYYIYLNKNELQAVIADNWKLYLPHSYRRISKGQPIRNDGIPNEYEMVRLDKPALYELSSDPSETINLYIDRPDIVEKMMHLVALARADLGDSSTNTPSKNVRNPGMITSRQTGL